MGMTDESLNNQLPDLYILIPNTVYKVDDKVRRGVYDLIGFHHIHYQLYIL